MKGIWFFDDWMLERWQCRGRGTDQIPRPDRDRADPYPKGVLLVSLPGYTWDEAVPISGDHVSAKPRWKERSDISELVDRPVRIEVVMREAFYAREPLQTLC